MTAIERTAYPVFKPNPSDKHLKEFYVPTPSELTFVQSFVMSRRGFLSLMVMLKSFQRLGYFPRLRDVPSPIIEYVRSHLPLATRSELEVSRSSTYRYQHAIRAYLKVRAFDKSAQRLAALAMARTFRMKDYPADAINSAIETLVKESYELPAFSRLERLAKKIRAAIDRSLFTRVSGGLSEAERIYLDGLLSTEAKTTQATLSLLKSSPKRASLSHLKELQLKFEKLMGFGEAQRLLAALTTPKVNSFAAQAQALGISELQDVNPPKRRTLLLCLLYRAQVKTRDRLVEMFLKRIQGIHKNAKRRLEELREQHLTRTEAMFGIFTQVLTVSTQSSDRTELGHQVQSVFDAHGGAENLLRQCEELSAYNTNNHLPLLWRFYVPHRKSLFQLVRSLDIQSTSQDDSLLVALEFLLEREPLRRRFLPAEIDLAFISEDWKHLVISHDGKADVLVRQSLEICLFTYLAFELKSGDACVVGSESYADFREQMLSWQECEPLLQEFCQQAEIPSTSEDFINSLRLQLVQMARQVDRSFPTSGQFTIGTDDKPKLRQLPSIPVSHRAEQLKQAIHQLLPERSVLDVLCNVEHWLHWTRHFGPLSGSEPKLVQARERYLFTVFGYGCNLGPNETARHSRERVTAQMLSYAHRKHISTSTIEAAIRDIINAYNQLKLPSYWGNGKRAAADGSKFEIYDNNLLSEYHIRYGGYGGIAYHHVSDRYIALFTHFIACGVWEAVYILDGLLKNQSDIQPDILHADTQGQSAPVFALAYLLGIELMPRIRNWQDYKLLRPDPDEAYEFIDGLFKDSVDWKTIQTHWQDMMRVALSIRAGKLMPSTILRKLGSYSRKNRLYKAFRALGQAIRTLFLLRYLSDAPMRRQITACTNKVENYHQFLDWLYFGKNGVIEENDPDEQEKRLKYLELVSAAMIFQNAVDISHSLQRLAAEGYKIDRDSLSKTSPYLTEKRKRYGDFIVDLTNIPQPFEAAISLPADFAET